jgi:hypothetical protein
VPSVILCDVILSIAFFILSRCYPIFKWASSSFRLLMLLFQVVIGYIALTRWTHIVLLRMMH